MHPQHKHCNKMQPGPAGNHTIDPPTPSDLSLPRRNLALSLCKRRDGHARFRTACPQDHIDVYNAVPCKRTYTVQYRTPPQLSPQHDTHSHTRACARLHDAHTRQCAHCTWYTRGPPLPAGTLRSAPVRTSVHGTPARATASSRAMSRSTASSPPNRLPSGPPPPPPGPAHSLVRSGCLHCGHLHAITSSTLAIKLAGQPRTRTHTDARKGVLLHRL